MTATISAVARQPTRADIVATIRARVSERIAPRSGWTDDTVLDAQSPATNAPDIRELLDCLIEAVIEHECADKTHRAATADNMLRWRTAIINAFEKRV